MESNPSWKTEFQEAFKNTKDLYQYLNWDPLDFSDVEKSYPLFIPKRLADKIKAQGPSGVLAREFLPSLEEIHHDFILNGLIDPIGDKEYAKAPQLIHRYQSRALFTPTSLCPVHCRYCFRKNELNPSDELFSADFDQTLAYLGAHPEISEIIFTGGDPLTLSNEKIAKYLEAFSSLKSIKDIRFHTRYPVILPSRLDEGFFHLLEKYSSVFRTITLAIHANHVDEFDPESIAKISKLGELPIQLLSQTVLLRNINDSSYTLIDLFNLFITLKIRPYYLHHPDQVKGGLHFYLPLTQGRKIYAMLRDTLPGWAIPHYIIDIPGGEGKVSAFNPESFDFSGQLISRHGHITSVREPDHFGL